jgi:hypothetical protein
MWVLILAQNGIFNPTLPLTVPMATCTSVTRDTSITSHVRYSEYPRISGTNANSELFLDGLQELGIPTLTDPNNGTAAGGMLIPDSINPNNQTRSYARLDYFDTVINTRQNLHVATHQHVNRVLLDAPHNVRLRDFPAGLWISGVEVREISNNKAVPDTCQFLTDGSHVLHNVSCSREVISPLGPSYSLDS